MSERLYTPADIFRARALGCQPEQLLSQGRTCADCTQYSVCQYACEWPIGDDNSCQHAESQFQDAWHPRRTNRDGEAA